MSVYLKLETGAGGTPLEALEKACHVAKLTTVMVRLEVNGIDVLIAPDDTPEHMHAQWLKALEKKRKFVSAITL
jgi:hypothetical protein